MRRMAEHEMGVMVHRRCNPGSWDFQKAPYRAAAIKTFKRIYQGAE